MTRRSSLAALLILLPGCIVHPPGEQAERNAALKAQSPYTLRIEDRNISPLPQDPTPDDLVQFALLNNADLERQYWEWRSAIEQIPQDGTQSAALNFGAGTNISNGRTRWRNTTLSLSNDPMTDIKLPAKLDAAAMQSLETAKAAGQRFIKAKFELRKSVLIAYDDYALTAKLIRLEQSNRQLLQTTAAVTQSRNRAGNADQQDVLKAADELDLSANDIASMQSQLQSQTAALNALLNRATDAPLPIPTNLPAPPLAYSTSDLLALAATKNPELLALTDEIHARENGLHLAKLQYYPDFNLSAGTDLMGVTQSIIGQATIPIFRYQALQAAVNQAHANLRAAEATLHQSNHDLAAQVLTDIATIKDADRDLNLFNRSILPRARQIVSITQSSYQTGRTSLLDLLDAHRSLIALQRLTAQLQATRADHLADLESLTTTDLTVAK
jgi:outer membrane protein, heavy metal efflux system